LRYWEITTDIETIPENSTWYVMTQIPGVLAKEVGLVICMEIGLGLNRVFDKVRVN
jgi:hypothetical protein